MKIISSTSRILAAGAALVLLPALSAAQEPVKSFDQLNTRLKVGDTVWVTDAQGREVNGRIGSLSATSLLLDARGSPQDLQAAQVGTIRVQQSDSLANGALIGIIGGGVLGGLVLYGCLVTSGQAGTCAGTAAVNGAIVAAIGVGIDAAIKGPKLVVYRAPGASGSARLSLAPVITPARKGVAVSVRF